ncbi:MAG: hypothetical protein ACOX1Y_12115 [Zhaonellaceae bacterium]
MLKFIASILLNLLSPLARRYLFVFCGKIIAQDNQFTGQKGYGRFIKRRIGEDVLTSPSWQRRVKG